MLFRSIYMPLCTKMNLAILVLHSILSSASAATSKPISIEEEIKRLDHKWAQAYVKSDIPTLQELMSDELVTTDATGTTFLKGKEQDIEGVRNGSISYEVFKIEDVKVKAHGDTAIAVGRFSMKGKAGKKEFSGRYAYTETWIKRSGKWQAIAEHITSIQ